MDQTMIDITDIPEAKIGDVVTVYSNETFGGSSIDHAAEIADTICYELLCCIGTRVPRLYIENRGKGPAPLSLITKNSCGANHRSFS